MAKFPTFDQITAMPLRRQAIEFEERRHRARLQELKGMAAALALLEAEHAAIKAAGYTIYPESIVDAYRERLTLQITGSAFDGDFRLSKALLLAGFVIADRGEGNYRTTRFKKGRLTLRVYMTAATLERVEGDVAAASAPVSGVATEAAQ